MRHELATVGRIDIEPKWMPHDLTQDLPHEYHGCNDFFGQGSTYTHTDFVGVKFSFPSNHATLSFVFQPHLSTTTTELPVHAQCGSYARK